MPNEPEVDTIDPRELAAQYGWALSVLKSDPGLARKFNQAVAGGWTPERFVAEIRSTKWFQHHSEQTRNALVLQKTDPKTWEARINQTRALIRDLAVNLGAQISEKEISRLSKNVLTFGWNDAQIKDTLAGSIKEGAVGTFGGQAAADSEQLRALARRNGVKLGDTTLRQWLVRMGAGESIDGFEQYVRKMASSAFPAWAEHLQAGMDLEDVVEPYKQAMASTLEMNAADIDLFDPTIRKTLQSVDKDGKPVSKPLYQFERELKQDPRWRKTNNARDELMSAGQQVLRDFGLA